MSIVTPVGTVFPVKNRILSNNINVSIGSLAFYTGSVVNCENFLNKAIFVAYSGASAADNSLGSNSGAMTLWYSYDNLWWNTGVKPTLLDGFTAPVLSGSFSNALTWYCFAITTPIPYVRAYVYNGSGAAVSGSLYVVGYNY